MENKKLFAFQKSWFFLRLVNHSSKNWDSELLIEELWVHSENVKWKYFWCRFQKTWSNWAAMTGKAWILAFKVRILVPRKWYRGRHFIGGASVAQIKTKQKSFPFSCETSHLQFLSTKTRMAAASEKVKSCGGLCMNQLEFLENCLVKSKTKGSKSLIQQFLKGRGQTKNPCLMTEKVSIHDM